MFGSFPRARVAPSHAWLGVGGACSALVLLLVAAFPTGAFQAWDPAVDVALRALDATPVLLAALALDAMGSIEWVAIILFALVGLLAWERRPREALVVLGAFVVAEAGTDVLKMLFERARPLDGLLVTHSASFPSGHAMRGAILAVLVGWYAWGRLASRPRVRALAVVAIAAWGAAMGVARLVLHVHWLSDVVVGSAIGVGVGALGVAFASHPAQARRVEVTQPVAVGQPVASAHAAPEDSAR